MVGKRIAMACLAASMMLTSAARVLAGDDAIVGGVIGGIIGGVIVNEANRNRNQRSPAVRTPAPVNTATRQQNREIQTSLNYFGFPSGPPDGVIGRQSRAAISQYQAFMGYPATGQLTEYERQFLVTSYNRAIVGGAATAQMIAQNPYGARGLLYTYRDEAAGIANASAPGKGLVDEEGLEEGGAISAKVDPNVNTGAVTQEDLSGGTLALLPNFMAGTENRISLASQCNQVSLLTNSNGGFVTEATMSDPGFALNEQFCLARTYAIAQGEQLAAGVQGVSSAQIEEQCEAFGPAMRNQIAALSLKPQREVAQDVSGFILSTGMSPAQLSGTAKICLSVGYRTDNMDVALGSALVLTVLGEQVYSELIGHHLSQGFGTSKRPDLALAWYQVGFDALDSGATAVFAPGDPNRGALIRKAAFQLSGQGDQSALPSEEAVQPVATLPTFSVDQ